MPEYQAPLRDIHFVLHEVFAAESVWAAMPQTAEFNRELADSILEEGAKICSNLLAPLNRSGDEEGVRWENGKVKTPAGFREAFKTYAENAWIGLGGNPAYGGQGVPKMLNVAYEEMLQAANNSFCLYATLTFGAALALDAHASEELKSFYLPRLYSGEWTGVMCLTEPHAGSDLGIIRTRAEDNGDGSYCITGTKIFITGGEHDMTDNIIHLVLAKLPDSPAGSKGISLFLVPKIMPNPDGSLGRANAVSCASVEHKMGIHASATCVMNFDAAQGFLVGEINRGLNCMFTMMNYERLSMGIQGLGCSEMAYQASLAYARDRLQGRAPEGLKQPDDYADPIIHHPDVRRMLLTQKAYIEAGRAFSAYVGMQLDCAKYGAGEEQARAEQLVALLTPVAKAFMSDKGLECCVLGQQVFGGHGYIREWGVEQLVRDVRIAQIYEGTNGIQALDLADRKVVANKGAYVDLFLAEMEGFITETGGGHARLEPFLEALSKAIGELRATTQWLLQHAAGNKNEVGAASVEYLHLFGFTAYAYMWARMAKVASQAEQGAFYDAKLKTGMFFIQRLLPQVSMLAGVVQQGCAAVMAHDVDQF